MCVLVRLECGEDSFTDTRDGVIIYYIIEIQIPAYLVFFFSCELLRAGSSVLAINGVFLSRILINANHCETHLNGGGERGYI